MGLLSASFHCYAQVACHRKDDDILNTVKSKPWDILHSYYIFPSRCVNSAVCCSATQKIVPRGNIPQHLLCLCPIMPIPLGVIPLIDWEVSQDTGDQVRRWKVHLFPSFSLQPLVTSLAARSSMYATPSFLRTTDGKDGVRWVSSPNVWVICRLGPCNVE